ncbi:MAG TPA: neutral/alkaline non-lysosomal ceramidase N-terminal domain-containing protein [Mucilaginibacter sp.]
MASFAGLKVGIARKVITPQLPMWMTGYAAREKPANGILHDIWAKAMVLEASPSSKIIIVTTDLLGLSHEVVEGVTGQIVKKYGITRAQLLLNASHTHSGPMVWPNLGGIADYTPEQQQIVSKYSQKLTQDIVAVIEDAMSNLEPALVYSGHTSADFAINRRLPTPKGVIISVNKDGPVDHDVPVLKVAALDGTLRAVLFGYACHNTTIQGDNYKINGDYAGFAQLELEKENPGVTAMFLMGCAGDQNPAPRGTIALAEEHGKALAGVVQKALSGKLAPVNGPIRSDYKVTNLDFKPVKLEDYQRDIIGTNVFLQRRAKLMLEAYSKSWNVGHFPYIVQAVRFGKDLTIVALSGEVVVDYSLNTKKAYAKENIFMAGYCNDVTCYIPTKRILAEGGYEAEDNLIYYSMPGPFADNIEDKISAAIHQVMLNIGVKPSKKL